MGVIPSSHAFASINTASCLDFESGKVTEKWCETITSAAECFTQDSFVLLCLIQPSLETGSPAKVKNVISLTLEGSMAHLKCICTTGQYFIVKTNQTQQLDKKEKSLLGPKCRVKYFVPVQERH